MRAAVYEVIIINYLEGAFSVITWETNFVTIDGTGVMSSCIIPRFAVFWTAPSLFVIILTAICCKLNCQTENKIPPVNFIPLNNKFLRLETVR